MKYIIGIDQSTQGTKALIFNQDGKMICRSDKKHKQIVNESGWVSHDLYEIYKNTLEVVKDAVEKSGILKKEIVGIGISNQRETSAAWNGKTGEPLANAIVWQCSRAENICEQISNDEVNALIKRKSGIPLSPYFPASKMAWFIQNVEEIREIQKFGDLRFGTIDTWLVYKLTGGKSFKTDYSNASRTQLFNINTMKWDNEICDIFGIKPENLAEVCDSNSVFGMTDIDGYLPEKIPICAVLGDSHGALFGQGCINKGMIKATYGTGSSVMMNIGDSPIFSDHGLVTSLAWGIDGKINYVLEGNVNYTGAVITWLKEKLGIIDTSKETEELALKANAEDKTYFVPAFTGLGAPYWDSNARAIICGMSRVTGKHEIVRSALDCIAYQIADIVSLMENDSGILLNELRTDGGPSRNSYLMQFQSDITQLSVIVPDAEEMSGTGVAYLAGIKLNIFDEHIFDTAKTTRFFPQMDIAEADRKREGWKEAVLLTMRKKEMH